MNKEIKERTILEAITIIQDNATVREVAKMYGWSKSTVHTDMHKHLKLIDMTMYNKVWKIFKHHEDIRHINGGISNKNRWMVIKG